MDKDDLPVDRGRRQLATGLVTLALAGLARPVAAQQAGGSSGLLYMVEIIVFRNGGGAGENLAATARDSGGDGDTAAGPARSARLGEILPAARQRLNDVASRLGANAHKVIAHLAWTQTAGAWNSGSGLSAAQLGLGQAGLSGSVQLERGTYLHLGFDLAYSGGGTHAMLSEMRRVKLAERNYYDHPALGIIAQVTQGG